MRLIDRRNKRSPDGVAPDDLVVPARGNRIYYDKVVKGFGCRVTAGGARSFVLNYRAAGRERRYTIGAWPDWSATAARDEAARLKREIDRGRDPMAERHHERQAPTVAELCDRYLHEHAAVHNKPSTLREVQRLCERVIKPKLGKLKVEAIDRATVMRFHRELGATARQANHALAVLSKMLNLAEAWALRPDGTNPCRHVRRYRENHRERFLSVAELERVGTVLRELETRGAIRPAVAACIRMLALSGCRLGEMVALRWADVDFEAAALRLPDAKAGARVVPLGAPALMLLAAMDRTGRTFVFEDRGRPVAAGTVERAWSGEPSRRQVGIRDRAGIPDVRLHDLRHGYGTFAGGAGLNAFIVRDLLGHKTMAMAGRYVNRDADPLRAAADLVSGRIAAALDGAPAEVVQLRGRQ